MTAPRRAVDLSPRALLAAGVSGVLAADLSLAEGGRWSLATRAEDLGPSTVRVERAGDKGAVAVVSVMGPIDQRATYQPCEGMTDGYDTIEARFYAAVDAVKQAGGGRVVQVIDSPGGDAAGMVPSVRRMRRYAQNAGVPVESVADERATSAAFALTLVGDKTHVPANGRTASIGTVMVRRQSVEAGSIEVFRSGDRKMRPNSVEPLNAEDRTDLQAMVDESASEFASLVAEVRGKTADHWLSFKGASMSGKAALEAGLVDTNSNAHEVIEMAIEQAKLDAIAGALGLSAGASVEQIEVAASTAAAALRELPSVRAQAAEADRKRIALEAEREKERLSTDQKAQEDAFRGEVAGHRIAGRISPKTEASILGHYAKHGEASARDSLTTALEAGIALPGTVKAKEGTTPGSIEASGAGVGALTKEQREHAKAIGVTEDEYARTVLGGGESK